MIGPLSAEQRSPHFLTALFRELTARAAAQVCNRQFHRIHHRVERTLGKRYRDRSFDSRVFLLHPAARTISLFRLLFRRADIFVRNRSRECQAGIARASTCPGRVLPQGMCLPPLRPRPAERARIRSSLRPAGWPADTVVILGAGTVTFRKGVDLFIACAKRVAEMAPSEEISLCRGLEKEWTRGLTRSLPLPRRSNSALRIERGRGHPKGSF